MALILGLKVIIDIWNLTCPGILNSDLSCWKKVQQVYMQLQEYLDIFSPLHWLKEVAGKCTDAQM